jgi:hypothetical protein
VPPPQCEVEKMFSTLVLVLTHLRNRLSKEVLNAILILKMNSALIHEIDFTYFKIFREKYVTYFIVLEDRIKIHINFDKRKKLKSQFKKVKVIEKVFEQS